VIFQKAQNLRRRGSQAVVLITKINKKELLALLHAFDINTLILLDMEVSQKICKLVPYTNANDNKEAYTSRESVSDNDRTNSHEKPKSEGGQYQTLFYNFTERDTISWNRIHV